MKKTRTQCPQHDIALLTQSGHFKVKFGRSDVGNRARKVAAHLTFESLYFLSRFIALNPGEPHRRAATRARRVNNFVGIRRAVGVVHDNPPR